MSLAEKNAQFATDVDIAHQIVHGPATGEDSTVTTAGGEVRTLAKLVADNDAAVNAAGLLGQVNDSKDAAAASASGAAAQAAAAEVSNQQAQAAAAATGVYATTAAGLAATTNGQGFYIPSASGNGSVDLYLNSSGVAVFQSTVPNVTAANTAGGYLDRYDDDGIHINPIRDGARRLLRWFDYAGARHGKLALTQAVKNGLAVTFNPATGQTDVSFGTVEGNTPVGGNGGYITTYDDDGSNAMVVVAPDATGKKRILMTVPKSGGGTVPNEVIAARGTRADLNTRLSVMHNAYGALNQPVYGSHFLRELRQRLRAIIDGDTKQLVIAFPGDSWTQGSGLPTQGIPSREYYFLTQLTMKLQAAYGNAGGGWCGLRSPLGPSTYGGSANPNQLYQSGTGSWAAEGAGNASYAPNLNAAVSSTPGDTITITCGIAATSAVKLFHKPGGAIQYRWNGGAWTQLDLSAGSGLQVAALAGFPTAATWTLDLQVVSGTVTLFGIDHQNSNNGIRVHNLGAGGSNAFHWQNVDQTQLQAGWAALGINVFGILLGTNDQFSNTVSGHKTHMQTIINSMRAAVPTADILLVTSPENSDTTAPRPSQPMALFQEADLELAIANKCAHMNLQYYFGDSITEYGYGTTRAWLNSSLIHPSRDGQRVIEESYFRLLTQSL